MIPLSFSPARRPRTWLTLLPFFFASACAPASEEADTGAGDADALAEVGQGLSTPALVAMSVNVRIPEDSGQRAWPERLPRLQGMINSYAHDGAHLSAL